MILNLQFLQPLLIGRRWGEGLEGIEVVYGGPAAGLDVGLHHGGGFFVFFVNQGFDDLQVLVAGIVNLDLVLLAGDDNSRVVVEQLVHHINNIAVAAVLDDEEMHGGVQAVSILDIGQIPLKFLAEFI